MPIESPAFEMRTAKDLDSLELLEPSCDLPSWLSREKVLIAAREAIAALPDDSEIILSEAFDKFPNGAVAVIPPAIRKRPRDFAVSTAAAETLHPANLGNA
jgi:hypothetical protein